MSEPVTSRPSAANPGSPGRHPTADERVDTALRELVRLLARIAVAEAHATADPGEQAMPDLPA
jgi:hypothetical protein